MRMYFNHFRVSLLKADNHKQPRDESRDTLIKRRATDRPARRGEAWIIVIPRDVQRRVKFENDAVIDNAGVQTASSNRHAIGDGYLRGDRKGRALPRMRRAYHTTADPPRDCAHQRIAFGL